MKRTILALLVLLPALALPGLAHAAVIYEWDQPTVPGADLAGFNVYRSTVSGQIGERVLQVPATNPAGGEQYIVTNQPDPPAYGTYYYNFTAYDTAGNESSPLEVRYDFFDNEAPPAPVNGRVRRVP